MPQPFLITVQLKTGEAEHTSYALDRGMPDQARVMAYFSSEGIPFIKNVHGQPILESEALTLQRLGIADFIGNELDDPEEDHDGHG